MGNKDDICICAKNQNNEKSNYEVPQNNLEKKINSKIKKKINNKGEKKTGVQSLNSSMNHNKNFNYPNKRFLTQKLIHPKYKKYMFGVEPEFNFSTINQKIINLNHTFIPIKKNDFFIKNNLQRTMIYIGIFGAKNSGKRSLYYKIFNNDLNTMENIEAVNEILANKRKYYYNYIPYDLNVTLYSYKDNNIYNYGKQLDYFIIMYDIGDSSSLQIGKNLIQFIEKKGYASGKRIILLANKTDLYEKEKYHSCRKFCEEKNYFYYHFSTKNDYELLSEIIENIIINFEEQFLLSDNI